MVHSGFYILFLLSKKTEGLYTHLEARNQNKNFHFIFCFLLSKLSEEKIFFLLFLESSPFLGGKTERDEEKCVNNRFDESSSDELDHFCFMFAL